MSSGLNANASLSSESYEKKSGEVHSQNGANRMVPQEKVIK